MGRTRGHQNGTLYKQAGKWSLRWREQIRDATGEIKTVHRGKVLAPTKDFTRTQAAELAREHMGRIQVPGNIGQIAVTVHGFVTCEYFPHVEATLAPSTVSGYRKAWHSYGYFIPDTWRMREMRTVDCQGILRAIHARDPKLTRMTLRHIKAFFSGIFTHALRQGVLDRGNPWQNVAIPAGQESKDTYAYSPAEISTMLAVIPEPANLLVLLAACTGLRRSEIRGLRWSDWNPDTSTLEVRRKFWGKEFGPTKSKASRAPVPVVPFLGARLAAHKARQNAGPEDSLFPTRKGTPMSLDAVANRIIRPTLKATSVKFRGWHCFRRGLATFLHASGIDDKTIQAILRHENVAITQASYIKTVDTSVRKAMDTVTFGREKELLQ